MMGTAFLYDHEILSILYSYITNHSNLTLGMMWMTCPAQIWDMTENANICFCKQIQHSKG